MTPLLATKETSNLAPSAAGNKRGKNCHLSIANAITTPNTFLNLTKPNENEMKTKNSSIIYPTAYKRHINSTDSFAPGPQTANMDSFPENRVIGLPDPRTWEKERLPAHESHNANSEIMRTFLTTSAGNRMTFSAVCVDLIVL